MKKHTLFVVLGALFLYIVTVLGLFGISRLDAFFWKVPEQEPLEREITVAGIRDFAPYSYIDANGNPAGYDVELIYAVGEKLGANIRIDLPEWEEALKGTENGTYELLLGAVPSDAGRMTLLLSQPVSDDTLEAFGLHTETRRISGLDGQRVAVLADRWESNGTEFNKAEAVVLYASYRECAMAVVSGSCDYAVLPRNYGIQFYKSLGYDDRIQPQGLALCLSPFCIATVTGNTALMNEVNAALSELDREGRIAEIYGHWLGENAGAENFWQYLVRERFELVILAFLLVIGVELLQYSERRFRRVQNQAAHDGLTGVYNRGNGEKMIREMVSRGCGGLFFIIDADAFKRLNDAYGHQAGDAALVAIADSMRRVFRDEDILVRFGGDEFAAFVHGVSDEETAVSCLQRLLESIRGTEVAELGGEKVSVSIGAALCPAEKSLDFDRMYRRVDLAMYEAKRNGGSSYRMVRPESDADPSKSF